MCSLRTVTALRQPWRQKGYPPSTFSGLYMFSHIGDPRVMKNYFMNSSIKKLWETLGYKHREEKPETKRPGKTGKTQNMNKQK
jgi:hypothetical protein